MRLAFPPVTAFMLVLLAHAASATPSPPDLAAPADGFHFAPGTQTATLSWDQDAHPSDPHACRLSGDTFYHVDITNVETGVHQGNKWPDQYMTYMESESQSSFGQDPWVWSSNAAGHDQGYAGFFYDHKADFRLAAGPLVHQLQTDWWNQTIPVYEVRVNYTGPWAMVAHSLGGLAARYTLESFVPDPSGMNARPADYISDLVTLGTPNYGSGMAYPNMDSNEIECSAASYLRYLTLSMLGGQACKETRASDVVYGFYYWDRSGQGHLSNTADIPATFYGERYPSPIPWPGYGDWANTQTAAFRYNYYPKVVGSQNYGPQDVRSDFELQEINRPGGHNFNSFYNPPLEDLTKTTANAVGVNYDFEGVNRHYLIGEDAGDDIVAQDSSTFAFGQGGVEFGGPVICYHLKQGDGGRVRWASDDTHTGLVYNPDLRAHAFMFLSGDLGAACDNFTDLATPATGMGTSMASSATISSAPSGPPDVQAAQVSESYTANGTALTLDFTWSLPPSSEAVVNILADTGTFNNSTFELVDPSGGVTTPSTGTTTPEWGPISNSTVGEQEQVVLTPAGSGNWTLRVAPPDGTLPRVMVRVTYLSDWVTDNLSDTMTQIGNSTTFRVHVMNGTSPVTGASVTMTIYNRAANQTFDVHLRDDGLWGDETAGDGIYSAQRTFLATGSYSYWGHAQVGSTTLPFIGDVMVYLTPGVWQMSCADVLAAMPTGEAQYLLTHDPNIAAHCIGNVSGTDPPELPHDAALPFCSDLTNVTLPGGGKLQLIKIDGASWGGAACITLDGFDACVIAQTQAPAVGQELDVFTNTCTLLTQQAQGACSSGATGAAPLPAPVSGASACMNSAGGNLNVCTSGALLNPAGPSGSGTSMNCVARANGNVYLCNIAQGAATALASPSAANLAGCVQAAEQPVLGATCYSSSVVTGLAVPVWAQICASADASVPCSNLLADSRPSATIQAGALMIWGIRSFLSPATVALHRRSKPPKGGWFGRCS
jgi:hypothetical protein